MLWWSLKWTLAAHQHFSALTVCYFIGIRCRGCQILGSMQYQLILTLINCHCSPYSQRYSSTGLKITARPSPRVFQPEPDTPAGFVGPTWPIESSTCNKANVPSITSTLLPAYQLYYTVPVSQPVSLAAPLLPTAAVSTFSLLLLDHYCHRGRGGYSSNSSKHVCDFSTLWSIHSKSLLLARNFSAPHFLLCGCSMTAQRRGGATVVLHPDWFSPLSILKMDAFRKN